MIKILKPGYVKTIMCPTCEAVLSYNEKEDVNTSTRTDLLKHVNHIERFIICPQCNNSIDLDGGLK